MRLRGNIARELTKIAKRVEYQALNQILFAQSLAPIFVSHRCDFGELVTPVFVWIVISHYHIIQDRTRHTFRTLNYRGCGRRCLFCTAVL